MEGSGDMMASIEMGLAQIMLELHKNGDAVDEIRYLLRDVHSRLVRLESLMDGDKQE